MSRTNAIGSTLLFVVLACIGAHFFATNQKPWAWRKAWLEPDHATRAQVMLGVTIRFCKEGIWYRLPQSAETRQEFLPATLVDGKLKIINGGSHPAGTHSIDLPTYPSENGGWPVSGCRNSPSGQIRLDPFMTIGQWAFVADTRAYFWYGEVKGMVILTPFEVTP